MGMEEIHALTTVLRSPCKLSHLHMLPRHLEPDVEAGCNHNTGQMEAETRGRRIWSQPSGIGKHFFKIGAEDVD